MIEKYNFHWKEGFYYDYPKKRALFYKLTKEIDSKQIISLIGLRRTGKTTILKQIIDYMIASKNIKRERIIFYSFDEEQPKIESILEDYQTRIAKEISDINLYVFLDEIQKLENWQNQIKYYYDNFSNIKFFVSGSSSLFIRRRTQESLAGRIYEFILYPLSFSEFLVFKGKKGLIDKKTLLRDSIRKEFQLYKRRQFIEIMEENDEKVARYTKTIIEKIVFQDIPKIFPIENEELLLAILKIIASTPGLLSDYRSFSQELGISRPTLMNYFSYLEESFLIKKLYNFSKNMITSEKKMKKFYITSPSFYPYLNEQVPEPKLIENLIISGINADFFWRSPQKNEVDIVSKRKNRITPIEVKYKDNISKKDYKNLLLFCEKFGVKDAVLVTKSELGSIKSKAKNISIIPAWKFLLEESIEDELL